MTSCNFGRGLVSYIVTLGIKVYAKLFVKCDRRKGGQKSPNDRCHCRQPSAMSNVSRMLRILDLVSQFIQSGK